MIKAFIVGMSRSGTTWLANCLNKHSKIVAFGETGFWGRNFVKPSENNRYSIKDYEKLIEKLSMIEIGIYHKTDLNAFIVDIISNLKKENKLLEPKELFNFIGEKLLVKEGKELLVEKTPHHINWVDRIVSYYPDVKFLVHYRNPYDFMLSYKHQGDRKSESLKKEFKKIYHPVVCALIYKKYVNSIINIDKHTTRYLCIKFERIKNEPQKVLKEVQEFLGVNEENIILPSTNTSFPNAEKKKLKDVDIYWMNVIAGKYFEKLGYKKVKVTLTKIEILKSLFSLFPWLFRALPIIFKKTASPFSYIARWLFLGK